MKIAITGHTAGIGQALAEVYASQGHEIVGLSRRNGYNIHSIERLTDMIQPCDIFINNAQSGFAQTELLFSVHKRWKDLKDKQIIVISTMMTQEPISSEEFTLYRIQKLALEQAVQDLMFNNFWPKITLVRPGAVGTQPGQTTPQPYADPTEWATTLVRLLDSVGPNLEISEISLGVREDE